MSEFKVQDIEVGKPDFTGQTVVEIFGKVSTRFAVYLNTKQVMIQFADDDNEGVNQRASLTPLLALRSEISAALADLALDPSAYQQAKVRKYAGQMGSALVAAMQGDVPRATSDLENILARMTEDSASDIRTWYLLWAAMATLATILLAWIIGGSWFTNAFRIPANRDGWPIYWQAASIGAFGALFSIALQLRAREVRVDTQPWDNISDAILRVFVGATSAALLTATFVGEFVNISLSGASIKDTSQGLFIIAFAAGFTERLAADFLSTIGLTGRRTPDTNNGAGVKAQNELEMAGAVPISPRPPGEKAASMSAESVATLTGANEPSEAAELAPDDDQQEYQGPAPSTATAGNPLG